MLGLRVNRPYIESDWAPCKHMSPQPPALSSKRKLGGAMMISSCTTNVKIPSPPLSTTIPNSQSGTCTFFAILQSWRVTVRERPAMGPGFLHTHYFNRFGCMTTGNMDS